MLTVICNIPNWVGIMFIVSIVFSIIIYIIATLINPSYDFVSLISVPAAALVLIIILSHYSDSSVLFVSYSITLIVFALRDLYKAINSKKEEDKDEK